MSNYIGANTKYLNLQA